MEDNEEEWAMRRARGMLGSLIANGVFTIPDLDLCGGKDQDKMLEHLNWMVL